MAKKNFQSSSFYDDCFPALFHSLVQARFIGFLSFIPLLLLQNTTQHGSFRGLCCKYISSMYAGWLAG